MITKTMNLDELCKEVLTDHEIASRKAFYQSLKIKKKQLKKKNPSCIKTFDYLSPKHNKWILVIEMIDKSPYFSSYTYYYNDFGLQAATVTKNKTVVHFTCHYFSRYKERMNLDIKDPYKLLRHYFINNRLFAPLTSKSKKPGIELVFAKIHDGISLGYLDITKKYTHMVFKTFVTHKMLHSNQNRTSKFIQFLIQKLEERGNQDFQRWVEQDYTSLKEKAKQKSIQNKQLEEYKNKLYTHLNDERLRTRPWNIFSA